MTKPINTTAPACLVAIDIAKRQNDVLVQDVQCPEASAVIQRVGHEVHRPLGIGSRFNDHGLLHSGR